MVVTSKAQHAVFGFWLAALVLVAGYPLWPKQRKRITAFAACVALLAAVWMTKSAPPDYPSRGVFTMAFYQILPYSKNLDRTIRDLGLDDSYRRYVGMHSFAKGSPMWDDAFIKEFRRRISYRGLAWFYLAHPRDAYMALRRSLNEAGIQRPYLGNFDVHTGYPRFHASPAFAFSTHLKRPSLHQTAPPPFFPFPESPRPLT